MKGSRARKLHDAVAGKSGDGSGAYFHLRDAKAIWIRA
jgi:hypothetical protein